MITRCTDVPPVPKGEDEISVGRSTLDGVGRTVHLFWEEGSERRPEFHEYTVRVDDPTCAKRPEIRAWFKIRAAPPQFEDAYIVVRPGQERAYVGYTIVGRSENQYAQPGDVSGVSSNGQPVFWKNQTSTGGPGDIVAMAGRRVVPPGSPDGGDAHYVDASSVKVGQTVTFTFHFETGAVKARFKVIAAT